MCVKNLLPLRPAAKLTKLAERDVFVTAQTVDLA
jgi:hypothetical protein